MLIIRDTSVVPPERWQYPGVGGYTVEAPNWNALYSNVVAHYEANQAAVPSLQDVIDYCCRALHVPCYESETRTPLVNKFSMNLPVPVQSCCGGKTG